MSETRTPTQTPAFVANLRIRPDQVEQALQTMEHSDFELWLEFLSAEAVILADDDFRVVTSLLGVVTSPDEAGDDERFLRRESRIGLLSSALSRGRIRCAQPEAVDGGLVATGEAFATRNVAPFFLDGDRHGRRAGFCSEGKPLLDSLKPLFASSGRVTVADPYLFAKTQRDGVIELIKACRPPVGSLHLIAVLPRQSYRGKPGKLDNPTLWDDQPLHDDSEVFWKSTRAGQSDLLTKRLKSLVASQLEAHLPPRLSISAEIWLLPDWQTGFHDRFLSFTADNSDDESPAIGVGLGRGVRALAAPQEHEQPTIVCRLHQSDLRFAGFSHSPELRLDLTLRTPP